MFGIGSLHALCSTWLGSAWCTLCTRGSAHACIPGAVFTACGRGAVQQPPPPHRASASKPAVPAATLLCSCLFWSSGRRTAGLRAPCALWFCSTRVCACELKWWESCFFFFEVNYLCMAMDVVCALPSHTRGNIIFTDGVTFYLLLSGNSNFRSFLPIRGWHRKIAVSLKDEICVFKYTCSVYLLLKWRIGLKRSTFLSPEPLN